MQLELRVERCFARPLLHQFDTHKQPAPTHIADMRMLRIVLAKLRTQLFATCLHVRQQIVIGDHALHFECGGTRRCMPNIRMTMLKKARAADDRIVDALADQRCPDRLIARPQALCDRQQIRRHTVLFAGIQIPGATHSRHDLVKNQQHSVAVANSANLAEIFPHWRHGARGCAYHRFRDKSGHCIRAKFEDFLFQLIRQSLRKGLFGFVSALLAIRVARADVMRFDQDRQERLAAPCIAANRQRPQRIAVIALAARNEMTPLRLALFDEVLACQL